MGLKEYRYNGGTFQFDEDAAPKGATLLEDEIVADLAKLEAEKAERLAVEEAERKQREDDERVAREAEEKAAADLAEQAERDAKAAKAAAEKQAPTPQNKARTPDSK